MPAPESLTMAPVVVTLTVLLAAVPALETSMASPTAWTLVAVTLTPAVPAPVTVALTPTPPIAAPAPTVPARLTVTAPLPLDAFTPSPPAESRSPPAAVLTETAPEVEAVTCTASVLPPSTVAPEPTWSVLEPASVSSWMPPAVPVTLALAV